MATQLELAEAQLVGYAHAKRGYEIESLVGNMGLKKSEWKKIKDNDVGLLPREIGYIDDYFTKNA